MLCMSSHQCHASLNYHELHTRVMDSSWLMGQWILQLAILHSPAHSLLLLFQHGILHRKRVSRYFPGLPSNASMTLFPACKRHVADMAPRTRQQAQGKVQPKLEDLPTTKPAGKKRKAAAAAASQPDSQKAKADATKSEQKPAGQAQTSEGPPKHEGSTATNAQPSSGQQVRAAQPLHAGAHGSCLDSRWQELGCCQIPSSKSDLGKVSFIIIMQYQRPAPSEHGLTRQAQQAHSSIFDAGAALCFRQCCTVRCLLQMDG